MAERKASNKYYPPEWTPDKGSLNTFHGSHPLRERAKRLHEGIMRIRFEMPYNIWCGGCGSHIGMGVRFNADKTQVGKYYSTPIFKFRMKCHLCDNYFEIQTDPKNCDYVVISGASRKNEQWEHKEGETVAVEGPSEAEKLAADPMYRLEHSVQDQHKAQDAAPRVAKILAMQEERKDTFTLNQILRKKFREEKAQLQAQAERDQELQQRSSLSIPLLEEVREDVLKARTTTFTTGSSQDSRKRKRLEIKSQSVLGGEGSKKARQVLLKACTKMDSSIFRTATSCSSTSTQTQRNSLGIRTATPKSNQ